MAATGITIEPDGSHDSGVCACCGGTSRRVWGYANVGDRCLAVYYVHWTLGQVREHGAHVDLIIGDWGEDAPAARRAALCLVFRVTENGPAFMVIDAGTRPLASKTSLVGRALSRDEVLGTPVAQEAFDIVDAVWLQDDRIAELVRP